jgi:hypothetical protein
LGTQQLVRLRCLASPLAALTPLLALERLILTPRIQIQPLALQRFCLTPPAQNTANGTAPLEFNTTGDFNTANGASALQLNSTGNNNTGSGQLENALGLRHGPPQSVAITRCNQGA